MLFGDADGASLVGAGPSSMMTSARYVGEADAVVAVADVLVDADAGMLADADAGVVADAVASILTSISSTIMTS
jgi:hypothetical protein